MALWANFLTNPNRYLDEIRREKNAEISIRISGDVPGVWQFRGFGGEFQYESDGAFECGGISGSVSKCARIEN
jgi:hypothetical protein